MLGVRSSDVRCSLLGPSQVVDVLAAQHAGVSELLKDTEEAVAGGRTGKEPSLAGV